MQKVDYTFLEKAKRFFEPTQSRTKIYIEGLIVALLWGINGIAHVFFLEKITYTLSEDTNNFQKILSIYGLYIITYEILNYLMKHWGWVKIEGATSDYVSAKYLNTFINIDNNYIESLGTGKLIAIMKEGIDTWGFLLGQVIEASVRLCIAIIFGIYIISKTSNLYALLFITLLIFFFFLTNFFNNKLFAYRKIRQINRVNISRQMIKVLMSKNEVLQNNSIEIHNKDISSLYDIDIKINQDMGMLRTFLVRNAPLGMAIILLCIYYFFGTRVIEGTISLSTLVGLTGSIIVIQRIISDSLISYIDFTKMFIKVESLWNTFDDAPRITGFDSGSPFQKKPKDIEINSISYGYSDTLVFSDFSLTIKRGQKTALVGASGGGKTTLMKLIAGYLHPQSGNISVLGNELSKTALKSYYPHIGYLTQDPSVFDATIRENLISAMNEKDATDIDKKLISALKLAHCDFVFDLEKGLDTEIGERGVRLSGGQKQRLAIAKIFLKDPEIILLDEPTSALDSFSEEAITVALDELFKDRTVIIIAHRLQTVKKSDEIIVLEGGKVVERGNHSELVEQKGIYNRMLELQSGF